MIKLTRDEILALPAGPELDALVAQEILDFKVVATDFPLYLNPEWAEWDAELQVLPDGQGGWNSYWTGRDESQIRRGAVYIFHDDQWPPQQEEDCNFDAYFFYGCKVPDFSLDISESYRIENKIKERGLEQEYIRQVLNLVEEVAGDLDLWQVLHATPEVRCKGVLLTLLQEQN